MTREYDRTRLTLQLQASQLRFDAGFLAYRTVICRRDEVVVDGGGVSGWRRRVPFRLPS